MTPIGPALLALTSWIGSLPTSDLWEAWDGEERDREGRWLPTRRASGAEWPVRPGADSHQGTKRGIPGADTGPLGSERLAHSHDVEVSQ